MAIFEDTFIATRKVLQKKYVPSVKAGLLGFVLPIAFFAFVAGLILLVAGIGFGTLDNAEALAIILPLVVIAVVIALMNIATTASFFHVIAKKRAKLSAKDIVASGWKNFFRYIGFSLGLFLIFALPIFLIGLLSSLSEYFGILLVPLFIYYFYLMVRWSVAIIYYFEEPGFINALKKSAAAVDGSWWRTFGMLIIGFLISSIISALTLFIWVLGVLISLIPIIGVMIHATLQAVIFVLVTPLYAAYLFGLREALVKEQKS